MFEWDEAKRKANRSKHGIDFDAVWEMDWASAFRRRDDRANYGEGRFVAFALLGSRLYCVAYTIREPNIRIISIRKANAREVRMYENETVDE
jgi:uncharacterized DUF497 family protein